MEFDFYFVFSVFYVIVGIFINIIVMVVVIIVGFYKNKYFIFVLNLFVSNLLMSFISFFLSIVFVIFFCV